MQRAEWVGKDSKTQGQTVNGTTQASTSDTRLRSVFGDTGSAARFFYTAKASASERQGVTHPTVKPLGLMRYLVRLVTPPGGIVLDPFMGSGTTIKAAAEQGFHGIGIEREAEYFAMVQRRLHDIQPSMLSLLNSMEEDDG
jgi:site-specific DNA-methyltransferase (adenine-specific)